MADIGPSCGLSYPFLGGQLHPKAFGKGQVPAPAGGSVRHEQQGQDMGCLAPNQHELSRSQDMTRMPLPSPTSCTSFPRSLSLYSRSRRMEWAS